VVYSLLKIYARLAIKIYCPKIIINKPEVLKSKGPLLLAANHPNSFLDGLILTTLFDQPVYSLARGDAFREGLVKKILLWLKQLPVYRTSEGAENLQQNYSTFEACRKIFNKDGIAIIFSEAACVNEWRLRPLRKGTARLAISSWQQGIALKVLPVGLNYNCFKSFGKQVHIYFGDMIGPDDILKEESSGRQLLLFNQALHGQLEEYVYEEDGDDTAAVLNKFSHKTSLLKTVRLAVPAFAGVLLHLPLFLPVKLFMQLCFKKSDHYDSIMTALLMLLYPLYILLVMLLLFYFVGYWSFVCLLVLPLTARCWTELKISASIFNKP